MNISERKRDFITIQGELNYMVAKKNLPEPVSTKQQETAARIAAQLRKRFSDDAIFVGSETKRMNVDAISTRSISLDLAIGIGGIPKGRIIEIFGNESSGKTTLALSIVAQSQSEGMLCAFIDTEHALDPTWAARIGVDLSTLLISQPDTGEDALSMAEELAKTGEVGVIVVDSVAALVPKSEIDGDMGDSHVALQARLMSQGLRKISGVLRETKTTLIFTNQLRSTIGGGPFAPQSVTPGGKALKFYASVRLESSRIETLKVKEVKVGNRTKVKVVKNKVGAPYMEAEFEIMFDEGISVVGEIIDLATKHGFINKSGAFYKDKEGNQLAQGRENLRLWLMKPENSDFTFSLHNKILERVGLIQLESKPVYNRFVAVGGHADQDPALLDVDISEDYSQSTLHADDDGVIQE